jgi:hypothetical protein
MQPLTHPDELRISFRPMPQAYAPGFGRYTPENRDTSGTPRPRAMRTH